MGFLKKLIFISSAIIIVLLVLVAVRILRPISMDTTKELLKPAAFDASREVDYAKECSSINSVLNKPIFQADTIDRNITVEKRVIVETPTFILRDIKEEMIPIIFKGSIVRGKSTIIAQINWGNKTHFIKPNEFLKGWQIIDITKDTVSVKDETGKQFTLELNKVTRSEELTASIVYTPKDQIYRVKKGEEIRGYKVVDIQKEHVLVSKNNSQITISFN